MEERRRGGAERRRGEEGEKSRGGEAEEEWRGRGEVGRYIFDSILINLIYLLT